MGRVLLCQIFNRQILTSNFDMELVLLAPSLRWRLPRDRSPPPAESVRCDVSLERSPQPHAVPFTLALPPADTPEFAAFLSQRVTFTLTRISTGEQLSTHSVALRECVPVLTEARVSWRDAVDWEHVRDVTKCDREECSGD